MNLNRLLMMAFVMVVTSGLKAQANNDPENLANKRWQEAFIKQVVENHADQDWESQNTTSTGRDVLNAITTAGRARWPISRLNGDDRAIAAEVQNNRNSVDYRLDLPSGAKAIVEVVSFYQKSSVFASRGGLRFHDIRIKTIGQHRLNLSLSEVVLNPSGAKKRVNEAFKGYDVWVICMRALQNPEERFEIPAGLHENERRVIEQLFVAIRDVRPIHKVSEKQVDQLIAAKLNADAQTELESFPIYSHFAAKLNLSGEAVRKDYRKELYTICNISPDALTALYEQLTTLKTPMPSEILDLDVFFDVQRLLALKK